MVKGEAQPFGEGWRREARVMISIKVARGIPSMTEPTEKKSELKAFLFLTVVMAPLLAGIIVAGYGFAVWIYQMIAGPPTS